MGAKGLVRGKDAALDFLVFLQSDLRRQIGIEAALKNFS